MSSVPRPLIAVLVVLVLFFALWTVALKKTLTGGGGNSASGNSPTAPALQSAIGKARGVQSLVNGAAAKAGGTPAASGPPTTQTASPTTTPNSTPTASQPTTTANTTPSASPTTAPKSHPTPKANSASTTAATSSASPKSSTAPSISLPATKPTGMAAVDHALQAHKVLALLFYNPAAADDRAVNAELRSIPTHSGKVVKLTVPLQKLGSFSSLLNEVPVNFSPTLVLVDRNRQADEITGFADSFEIAQRVAAALGSAPPKQSGQ